MTNSIRALARALRRKRPTVPAAVDNQPGTDRTLLTRCRAIQITTDLHDRQQ